MRNAESGSMIPHRFRALVPWIPVVLIMAAIFIASAQPKHDPSPGTTPDVYLSGWMPVFAGNREVLIKKGAHVLGYAILSGLIFRALLAGEVPAREASRLAILLALCYALTDELHQSLVPGRHASVLDMGLDYIGAATASLSGRAVLARRSKPPRDAHEKPIPAAGETAVSKGVTRRVA